MAEPANAVGGKPGPFQRIKAAIKRITPGEWALIAIGVVGIVAYIIWYRNQQAQNSITGTTNPNPNWQNAQATPQGTFDSELADLLSSIAANGTIPGTAGSNNSGGASGADGGGAGAGGIAGSAAGTGMAPANTGTGNVPGVASSGSGLLQTSNQAPTITQSTFTNATAAAPSSASAAWQPPSQNALGLANATGTVGVPLFTGSSVSAPANVTSNYAGTSGASGGPATVASVSPSQAPSAPPPAVINYAHAVAAASPVQMTHATAPVSYATVTRPSVAVAPNTSTAAPAVPKVATALSSRLGR